MKHEPAPTLPTPGIKFDELMRKVVRVKPEPKKRSQPMRKRA